MNARQQELKNRIDTLGHIDINDEAKYFAVSEMTIRRDITFLEKKQPSGASKRRRNSQGENL